MLNKVEICGISTATLPKVNQQEVEEMLIRLKNGEEWLKDEFIRCNLRLVLSVVQKFNNKRENLDDIFQIGCVGLIKSIDNFDFKYGVKFSTYAVPMDIESRKVPCYTLHSENILLYEQGFEPHWKGMYRIRPDFCCLGKCFPSTCCSGNVEGLCCDRGENQNDP